MKEQLRNLSRFENAKYIPLVVAGIAVAGLQLAIREIIRPYEEMKAERLERERELETY